MRPRISFMVVINGPVAKAGSILSLFRKSGIKVPKRDAKMITIKRVELTARVRSMLSLKK